jgi:hypothetical protein
MIPERQFAFRILGVGLVGCLLAAWCWAGGFAADPPAEADPPPAIDQRETEDNGGGGGQEPVPFVGAPVAPAVDLESKPLPKIPPGTVIGKDAPKGWSNFIMIAIPTLTPEDLRDAPKIATHYARMFKWTLLAKTEKGKAGYELKSVARGFAMTIRGQEVIVDSRNTFGGNKGVFGAKILAENEKHIDADVRTIARTPTMWLFDAQAVMRRGSDHARMVLRHAVVIDPDTGKAHTFIWLLSKDGGRYAVAEKTMQLIPEGLREQRYLSVKRDQFVLGLPTKEAFALVRTPQGKPIAWTEGVAKLASVKDLTKEQVLEVEKALLATGRAVTARK